MLHSLHLHNFALIDQLDLDFHAGFNVITGETGAGKSLILDALSLCMGGRADSGMVRHGATMAEVYAKFECHHQTVQTWFVDNHRNWDNGDILIRRQLSDTGRSKAWLNGSPVSLSELKSLGARLVHLHSQHAGLELLRPQFALVWLDMMGGLSHQAKQVKQAYAHWQALLEQQKTHGQAMMVRLDRIDLLTGKLADIAPLLTVDLPTLEQEYEELANIDTLIQSAWQIGQYLDNDGDVPSVLLLLAKACKVCEQHSDFLVFAQSHEQLINAQSILGDTLSTLTNYTQTQSPNPQRLAQLDELMSLSHRLSSKYRLPIGVLLDEAKAWQQELDALQSMPDADALHAQVQEAFEMYMQLANQLHVARLGVAEGLCRQLVAGVAELSLPNASFEFAFTQKEGQYFANGLYEVELLFSANVGMPKQPLHKVASGGELSRIALVMQVLSANQESEMPMLVFDEVDVGISGGTAQVLGGLLRGLGKHGQLLAITHQAQVAAAAHQHILVKKMHDTKTTSSLAVLSQDERIDELARMAGGVDITKETLAHAKSLFDSSQTA